MACWHCLTNREDSRKPLRPGLDSHQLSRMTTPPVGKGLLGYLNELEGTLRVTDISKHFRSVGFPDIPSANDENFPRERRSGTTASI